MRSLLAIAGMMAMGSLSCGGGGARGILPSLGGTSTAQATIEGEPGSGIHGTVTFIQEGDDVKVVADISGASPGLHGIHIHEHGDCGGEGFAAAGGHFNPTGAPHSCPPIEPRHAGDLGNIEIGDDGKGHLELTTDALSVTPGDKSVVGRSIVLHADKDDCESQPAGDSGARIACGVIHAE